jgi:predicted nucleotidyltransferase
VNDDAPLLDRAALRAAFESLGTRLQRRGVVADIYVIGGAAMSLAYDARRSTRDVDALFTPHGIVLEEAASVADEMGLPPWWLNEQASSYVAAGGDPQAPRVFDHPGLRVSAASPQHLLAMKTHAGRQGDVNDIRTLAGHLAISSAAEVIALCEKVFPDEPIKERTRLLLDELFDAERQDESR